MGFKANSIDQAQSDKKYFNADSNVLTSLKHTRKKIRKTKIRYCILD